MQKALRTFLSLILSLCSPLALAAPSTPEVITVYAHDSFTGKGTLGEWVAAELKKSENVEVRYVPFSSAGESLNQVALEGKQTKADVVVGLDNSLLGRAAEVGLFDKLESGLFADVERALVFDPGLRLLPYDYGFLTILYDATRPSPLVSPLSLKEFAVNPSYAKQLVMADPRTSTTGLGFLLGTRAGFPDDEFQKVWRGLAKQIRTVTPGWSAAYGLFLKKEVSYVVSYTTSPAYHIENDKNDHVRAVVFKEGNYRQIEAAALVSTSTKKASARKFLKLLLAEETQRRLPTLQWMYPARRGTKLPESFARLPDVLRPLDPPPQMTESNKKDWLREWARLVGTK